METRETVTMILLMLLLRLLIADQLMTILWSRIMLLSEMMAITESNRLLTRWIQTEGRETNKSQSSKPNPISSLLYITPISLSKDFVKSIVSSVTNNLRQVKQQSACPICGSNHYSRIGFEKYLAERVGNYCADGDYIFYLDSKLKKQSRMRVFERKSKRYQGDCCAECGTVYQSQEQITLSDDCPF